MKALDLFRGAGGWSVGARMLGITDHGVENWEPANATAEAAGFKTVHRDVWTLAESAVFGVFYDGHIASPPCQTFSQSGKGSGRKALDVVLGAIEMEAYLSLKALRQLANHVGDERTALVLTPLFYALQMRPTWIAWEQVPAVLPVWQACAEVIRASGYHVWVGYVYSEQHGVPQTRKRATLIASQEHEVRAPLATHSRYHSRSPQRLDPGVRSWIPLAEGLAWPQHDGECDCQVVLRTPSMGRAGTDFRWNPRHTAPDGRGRYFQQSDNVPDFHWVDNRPSTVVAGRGMVGAPGATWNATNGSTKSRNDGVRVSVQEAGVLQSFPTDFQWHGSMSEQYQQVGNSVPPLMARAVLLEASAGVL